MSLLYNSGEVDRFWKKVTKPADSSCWLWSGATNRRGYGVFHVEPGVTESAHRFSYKLAHPYTKVGPKSKLFVLHACDNRLCVNPAHLRPGSAAQNSRDMVKRGRTALPSGKAHGNAKLTWAIVRGIRRNYKGGWGAIRALRAQYGVSKETIKDILAGRSWKEKTQGE